MPSQDAAGVAGCGWYSGRSGFPSDRQGGRGPGFAAYLPIGGKHRQGICRAGRLGRQHVFRTFAASRLPDFCGRQGGLNLQDDECVTAQVGGYSPGLRPRRRTIQGSCGGGIAMKAFGTSAFANIADSSRTLRDVCFVPWKRTFRKRFFLIAALPIWWGRSSGPGGERAMLLNRRWFRNDFRSLEL